MSNKLTAIKKSKANAIAEYYRRRLDDPEFADQWADDSEDFKEWYQQIYLYN